MIAIGLKRTPSRLVGLIGMVVLLAAILPCLAVAQDEPNSAAGTAPTNVESDAQVPLIPLAPPAEPVKPADEIAGEELPDELMELEALLATPAVTPGDAPATLTELEPVGALPSGHLVQPLSRMTPAAVTRIGFDDIWSSGARSLDELFDIYVPNFEHVQHVSTGPKLGVRGIISDSDDKVLLKVNGRIMNNRSAVGAFSERDLPLLGDLHHVDFLRGPGGATDGPGAIVGVMNLQTHTGLTFQGLDATVRQGLVENFTATELRYGLKIDEETGLFLYYGIADYNGADQSDAPQIFGRSFTARDGIPVVAGQPVTYSNPNDGRSYRSRLEQKAHAQFTRGNFDAWVRYTRGGQQTDLERSIVAQPAASFADLQTSESGYQQLTVAGKYLFELSDELTVELLSSWDLFDFERFVPQGRIVSNREDESYTRLLTRWTPDEENSVAFGAAYSHERFGLPSPGFPDLPPFVGRLPPPLQGPWETNTFSLMGEYVHKFNDYWTGFAGARGDKHTYSDWLISPRASLVFTPNERDTYKAMWGVATRRALDAELRRQFLELGSFSENEENESVELRYERRPCDHIFYGASGFYQDYTSIGFNPTLGQQSVLGEFQIAGLELEASYRTETRQWVVSHSYTKLMSSAIPDITRVQGVTAEPYGFGSDLASWSPHLTKIYANQSLNDLWSVNGSIRAYWGFPGDEDLANYNASLPTPSGFLPLVDPGFKKSFRGSYFLDFGLERKFGCGNGVARLDLYNVLGWIDKDLNKRNVLRRASWRDEAAAIGMSVRWTF